MNDKEIKELEQLIKDLQGVSRFIKGVLLILVEESNNLTEAVCTSFEEYRGAIEPIVQEAERSRLGLFIGPKTAINNFLRVSGADFQLEVSGGPEGFGGDFEKKKPWISFNLSRPGMGNKVRYVGLDALRIDNM